MALFKISKGTAANLVANRPYAAEGNAYFTTDDGKFYIDISGDGSTTAAVVGTNRIPLNASVADSLANSLFIDNKSYNGSAITTFGNTIYYVEGNTTGTAGEWTGSVGNIGSLYPGFTIAYKIGIAGKSGGTTLDINGYGAKAVKRNDGNFTTHVPVNSVIILVYDGTVWRWADYDNNTTTTLNLTYASYKPKTNLYRYQFLFTVDEEYLLPTNTVNNSTATTKTLTTDIFDIFGEIYYYNSTTTINANTLTTSSALYSQYSLADLRYGFNTGKTLVAGQSVYLVCEPQGARMVKLHSTPIAQDLPTTEDGLIYKYLGQAYDTYRIVLHQHKPCYEYKNGSIRPYTYGIADSVANSLTIQLNGGTTQTGANPDMFVYNGSATKTINITPASIGALSASDAAAGASKWTTARDFIITDADGINNGVASSVDGSANVTLHLPSTIKATLTGNASSSDKVNSSLTIQLNGGTTETGSSPNKFVFDGSATKTIDITPSAIGALASNASAASADKWTTARNFKIASSDGSNESVAVSVDGSGNVILKLAGTIKADLDGNATSADQVNHTLTIQLNGGTDVQHKVEFDGSGTKSMDITPTLIGAVDKIGDTMTGFLTLNADPTNAMHAATKQYVESYASVVTIRRWS